MVDIATGELTDREPTPEGLPVAVVAEQQRAQMRPRSFRVRPPDDDEFLAIESFGFAPEAPVSRGLGSVFKDALKSEFAGMLADEFAVADLVLVELDARNTRD